MTKRLFQTTLAESVSIDGIGLHTGKPVSLEFCPAEADSGIFFIRTDLPDLPKIDANINNVTSTNRGTTIEQNGVTVCTVEHVLASLYGLGIDNCKININGQEPPATDGSSAEYASTIKNAGKSILKTERKEDLFCNKSFSLVEDDKQMHYLPSDKFEITFRLEYSNNILPAQVCNIVVNENSFFERISIARTFGFEHEFDMLAKNNLALGGSLKNAVLIDNSGKIKNPEGLRDPQELVMHKILDLIGDFALTKKHIKGHIIANKTGHSLNIKFAKLLLEKSQQYATRKETNEMNIEEIKEVLPHRYPFLLVDRIISIDPGKSIVGMKNVTANEDFFNGHFPGQPVMPGVLIVEAMAQVAGVLFLSQPDNKGKTPFFCGIDKIRFRRPVVPGDRLDMTAKVLKLRGNTGKVEAETRVDGKLVTAGELMFQMI